MAALAALGGADPAERLYSLCPLDNLGFTWCPGCGLGRAITLLMRGEILASIEMHPFGGFALAVIIYRIFEIIQNRKKSYYYGKRTETPS